MKVGFMATDRLLPTLQTMILELFLKQLYRRNSTGMTPEFHHRDTNVNDVDASTLARALCYSTIAHPNLEVRAGGVSGYSHAPVSTREQDENVWLHGHYLVLCTSEGRQHVDIRLWRQAKRAANHDVSVHILTPDGHVMKKEKLESILEKV